MFVSCWLPCSRAHLLVLLAWRDPYRASSLSTRQVQLAKKQSDLHLEIGLAIAINAGSISGIYGCALFTPNAACNLRRIPALWGDMRTLEIVHRTRYEYAAPVTLNDYRLMFRPRDSHDLRLLHTGLVIEPAATVRWIHDPFGNSIAIAAFQPEPVQALELTSTIRVEHFGGSPELPPIEEYARKLPFSYLSEEAPDLARYVERHYPDPNAMVSNWIRQFLETEGDDATDTYAVLVRMCQGIKAQLTYAMRFEIGTQTPAVTLETGGGTCRDYALLMMEGVRSLGLAARFITGYLYDPALDSAAGQSVSTAYPHAWMEVYLPGAGWVEFDPTNGIVGSDGLIRVAVARDPDQAMPIRGTFTGAAGVGINSIVDVQVRTVEPVPEPPIAPTIAPTPEPAIAPEQRSVPSAKVIKPAA
jgi:transglutaminase-like putative cysteine protease